MRSAYGKGWIYFLGAAPEQFLCRENGAFECKNGLEYYKLYEYIFKKHTRSVITGKSSHFVGVTEHPMPDGSYVRAAVNYADKPVAVTLETERVLNGVRSGNVKTSADGLELHMENGGICIFELS